MNGKHALDPKVSELRQQVANNGYQVDPQAVAARIVGNLSLVRRLRRALSEETEQRREAGRTPEHG